MPACERNRLPDDADVAPAHPAVPDQARCDELRRIRGNRKTDPLRSGDDRGIDPDHFGARVHERSARISRIQRCVRLNDAVD